MITKMLELERYYWNDNRIYGEIRRDTWMQATYHDWMEEGNLEKDEPKPTTDFSSHERRSEIAHRMDMELTKSNKPD